MTILDHFKAWFRDGLDEILADMNYAIARLERHAGYQAGLAQAAYNNASQHEQWAKDALQASSDHSAAADKALQIKARIAALVA